MPNKYILYVITTIVTAIIVFAYTMREYYKGEKGRVGANTERPN